MGVKEQNNREQVDACRLRRELGRYREILQCPVILINEL